MLKICCGFTRKVGEPGFSSRGASVGLELEAETQLCADPLSLHQRIQGLFTIARAAVDRELNMPATGTIPEIATREPTDHVATNGTGNGRNGNGRGNGHGNGKTHEPPASNRQLDFILSLARDHEISPESLEKMCVALCGSSELSRMTRPQASALIARLQETFVRAGALSETDPQPAAVGQC
jgi:hypothetical protein